MSGGGVRISSSGGGHFDCYVSQTAVNERVPAVVLASSILGVDDDIRAMADEFAGQGYIAAAPDLFWRFNPGPLPRGAAIAAERAQPRARMIEIGEADMVDTLAFLDTMPGFNGRAAVIGICYGGPYALIGPKRLGYSAGVSCHGSEMLNYVQELDRISKPVCLLWGDHDERAPPEVLDAFLSIAERDRNLDVRIFPGMRHGYMMPSNKAGFSARARKLSMRCALKILDGLRAQPELVRASDSDQL